MCPASVHSSAAYPGLVSVSLDATWGGIPGRWDPYRQTYARARYSTTNPRQLGGPSGGHPQPVRSSSPTYDAWRLRFDDEPHRSCCVLVSPETSLGILTRFRRPASLESSCGM